MKILTWFALVIVGALVISLLTMPDNEVLGLFLCFTWGMLIPSILRAVYK